MRRALLSFTALSIATIVAPAMAQVIPVENRVDRLEKEMRAVQRKVFPGGAPVQPDMSAAAPAPAALAPSSTPVSDLMARVDALETQLASLTGQVEQNNYRLKKLEDGFARYKADMDSSAAVEAGASVASAPAKPAVAPAPVAARPVTPVAADKPVVVTPAAKPAVATPAAVTPATKAAVKAPAKAPATTAASEARKLAVAAVERRDTGNAAEDGYNYGYRLWAAKFYPEAQVQLKTTLDKYGTSPAASRTANLLGRAYLDDNQTERALLTFYDNYQKRPRGDRAADSLAYMSEALIRLKRLPDACKVYTELQDGYGDKLSPTLRSMMEKGRVRAKCAV